MIALEASVKNAVEWILHRLREDPEADRSAVVDQASQRFNLSHFQTDFLYRRFLLEGN